MIASNQTFVIAAYALTWAVLFGYLWRLVSKDRRVHADRAGGSGENPL